MSTYQRVTILGRLGRDPEKRTTQGGASVCSFSLATDEGYKDRDGHKVERTEWHNIVAWGPLGERCAEYLRKGSLALVEGKLQTREYEDRDGNKRKATEVVAERVTFVGGRKEEDRGSEREDRGARENGRSSDRQAARSAAHSAYRVSMNEPPDDDLPF
jgi:single-strand DNA-binding protein